MLELNRAAAAMKRVFDPYVRELDPQIEEDSSAGESADGAPERIAGGT